MSERSDKLRKQLDEDFVKAVAKMGDSDLKGSLVHLLNEVKKIDETRDNDVQLKDFREKAADLSAGYRDKRKREALKLDYLLEELRDRGSFTK